MEGGAALFDGFNRQPVTVHRDIHQGAGLHCLAGLLHQNDFPGKHSGIIIPRLLHRRAAHGFGEHIVAKGAQVPIRKGFEVDNGGVGLPFAGGPYLVLRETLAADRLDVLDQLLAGNQLRKPDALNAGQLLVYPEAQGEGPPLLAIDGHRSIKKGRAAVQNLGASSESGIDVEPNLVAGKVELTSRLRFHIRLAVKRGEHGDDQPGCQQAPCAP